MPIKVLMPSMSPTMTEGTVTKWYKKEGDAIAAGDALAEIETDKATMDLEAVDEGRLARILVPARTEGVPVNKAIAVLLEEGEAAAEEAAAGEAAPPVPAPAPAPEPAPAPAPAPPPEPQPEAKARPAPAPRPTAPPGAAARRGARLAASPLAKRIARDAGLDLAAIRGTGPRGRIVKTDVEAALARGVATGLPAPFAAPAAVREVPGLPPFAEVPVTSMRKVIAQRLTESKREAPHFYLTIDCEVDSLLKIRAELNSRTRAEGGAEPRGGDKLSVNDFIVRAVALALDKVPAANVSWAGDVLRQYQRADIAVAVAVPGGLVAPVIRDAGRKGLAAIAAGMRDLAARARAGKLVPEEYQGGTFTVSNLGMYGIKEFAAVLNPPQACLLAVGEASPRPVVKDGALSLATVMTCTLSIDHRAVDGATGAEFLAAFKGLIEDPLTMLL
jgi:pyruvate dehydrogenase E2 component (dihydrolipoamide acetyltransferase)